MIKTNFTIKEYNNSFKAIQGSKVLSHTLTLRDCLESIFVIQGRKKGHYYHSVNNFVYLEIEDEQ